MSAPVRSGSDLTGENVEKGQVLPRTPAENARRGQQDKGPSLGGHSEIQSGASIMRGRPPACAQAFR